MNINIAIDDDLHERLIEMSEDNRTTMPELVRTALYAINPIKEKITVKLSDENEIEIEAAIGNIGCVGNINIGYIFIHSHQRLVCFSELMEKDVYFVRNRKKGKEIAFGKTISVSMSTDGYKYGFLLENHWRSVADE